MGEPDRASWSATDRALWDEAAYREERYAALAVARHRRAGTDTDLLRHAVEANVEDPSFWLRKAVGWALRDHARSDPAWVRAEVERLGDRLSGLSRREAVRHL